MDHLLSLACRLRLQSQQEQVRPPRRGMSCEERAWTFGSYSAMRHLSEQVTVQLEQARDVLEAAIPSVGRIDLRNHDQLDWAGTGWMIGPGLVITNRHVAEAFASRRDGGFAFRVIAGKQTHAMLDWYQEYQQPEESRFRVTEIAWIEPDESLFDVALLRIAETGEEGQTAPPVVGLLSDDDLADVDVGRWIAVIGYPGYDSRADPADQQRIFGGVYGCKRLAAGQVLAVEHAGLIGHDATTLGGNSGSALIDLSTGKAIALHFGGRAHVRNSAVSARAVDGLVREHGT